MLVQFLKYTRYVALGAFFICFILLRFEWGKALITTDLQNFFVLLYLIAELFYLRRQVKSQKEEIRKLKNLNKKL